MGLIAVHCYSGHTTPDCRSDSLLDFEMARLEREHGIIDGMWVVFWTKIRGQVTGYVGPELSRKWRKTHGWPASDEFVDPHPVGVGAL